MLVIKGTDALALTSGFHFYLKYVANCSVSWWGDQLALPLPLPLPARPLSQSTTYTYRYYMVSETYGYSTAFWDWARWEREIGACPVCRLACGAP